MQCKSVRPFSIPQTIIKQQQIRKPRNANFQTNQVPHTRHERGTRGKGQRQGIKLSQPQAFNQIRNHSDQRLFVNNNKKLMRPVYQLCPSVHITRHPMDDAEDDDFFGYLRKISTQSKTKSSLRSSGDRYENDCDVSC